jgi:hypothetical protein
VFDELTLIERSTYETWKVAVVAPVEEDVDDLITRLRDGGVPAEDWTTIRMICAKCSTGTPHAHHGDELASEWNATRTLALALRGTEPSTVLNAWASAGAGRAVEGPLPAT